MQHAFVAIGCDGLKIGQIVAVQRAFDNGRRRRLVVKRDARAVKRKQRRRESGALNGRLLVTQPGDASRVLHDAIFTNSENTKIVVQFKVISHYSK